MHHLSYLTSSLTNHHPTILSTIDKNVTVRFYPWPHHPRGYYPPSRTTQSCLSSPRSSLPLFVYSLPTIRGVELILWLYRFHKLSMCRFAPHSTISPLATPTQSFAIFSPVDTALYFHTRLLSTHNCTYTYNHPSLPPNDRSIFSKTLMAIVYRTCVDQRKQRNIRLWSGKTISRNEFVHIACYFFVSNFWILICTLKIPILQ